MERRPPAAARRRVVATFDYTDEAGVLLSQVVRYEPKDFKQRRPDGRGGWIWNVADVRQVAYRLHELIVAMRALPQGERVVHIPEGEKDAARLWQLGLAATTNVGGAGKWTDDLTQQLKAAGCELAVIYRDNDRAGADHQRDVARSCAKFGLAVKRIELPGLAPLREKRGEDVSDWLDAGHTAEELRALVAAIPNGAAAGELRPVLVRLSDVKAKPVTWLWRGRIPRGKLTLLVGDPGLGKSLLLLDLGARITRGDLLPGGAKVPVGDVVVLSTEDGPEDTIRPRFDLAGGDPARAHLLRAIKDAGGERPFTLDGDLIMLEQVLEQTRPALLGIDPVSAYLGDRDTYKDSEVRALLAPLAALADRYGVAVVLIVHLGKNEQRRALYRALGSIAFVAAARSMLVVAQAPEDKHRRLVAGGKANLAGEADGLAYRVVGVCPTCRGDVADGMECRACGVQSVARLVWEDDPVPGLDADRLLGVQATPDERDESHDADEFLRELLGAGECKAADVLRAARENGTSERTLNRAKRRLGVRARHEGQPGKPGGAWYWSLPEGCHSKAAISPQVAAFGEQGENPGESARTSPKVATLHALAAFGGSLRGTVDEDTTPDPPASPPSKAGADPDELVL